MRRVRSGASAIAAVLLIQLSLAAPVARALVVTVDPEPAPEAPPAEEPKSTCAVTALPLASTWFERFGVDKDDLPCPLGIGFIGSWIAQDFETDIPLELRTDIQTLGSRVDLLLLPMLDIYGLFMEITATVRSDLGTRRLAGTALGGGVVGTLPWPRELGEGTPFGYRPFLVGEFRHLNISALFDDPFGVSFVFPRAGILFRHRELSFLAGALWGGASLQSIDHQVSTAGLSHRIDEEAPWNAVIGYQYVIGRRIELLLEGGVGGRSSLTAQLALRF